MQHSLLARSVSALLPFQIPVLQPKGRNREVQVAFAQQPATAISCKSVAVILPPACTRILHSQTQPRFRPPQTTDMPDALAISTPGPHMHLSEPRAPRAAWHIVDHWIILSPLGQDPTATPGPPLVVAEQKFNLGYKWLTIDVRPPVMELARWCKCQRPL